LKITFSRFIAVISFVHVTASCFFYSKRGLAWRNDLASAPLSKDLGSNPACVNFFKFLKSYLPSIYTLAGFDLTTHGSSLLGGRLRHRNHTTRSRIVLFSRREGVQKAFSFCSTPKTGFVVSDRRAFCLECDQIRFCEKTNLFVKY
jgi:hypothetical protein